MNELIVVNVNENQEQVVSARELHEKLGIVKDFSDWIKYQIGKLGLSEGLDFTTILGKSTGGRPSVDYIIPLDIAKHLAMASGGEKAHQIRQYFIEVEKAWNNPEMVMARSLQYAQRKLLDYQKQIDVMTPKASYFDALVERNLLINIRDTAKELGIKQNTFTAWLEDNKYIYRDGRGDIKPYADYTPSLFELKEFTKGNYVGVQTLVTPKGRETFKLLYTV